MAVIKRSKTNSSTELVKALDEFIPLLQDQKEDEAVEDLTKAMELLRKSQVGEENFKTAIAIVVDAFDGDHELNAYTMQRENPRNEWTEAEVLSHASSRVISLARRLS